MNAWAQSVATNVGDGIKEARKRQNLTASELAEQVTAAGLDMTRAVITALETGRRATVSVPELLVFAKVLKVPPVALLYPDMPDKVVEVVPGVETVELDAALWVAGELPLMQVEDGALYPHGGDRFSLAGEDTRMRDDYRAYVHTWQELARIDPAEQADDFIAALAEVLSKFSQLRADGRPVRNPLDYLLLEPEGRGQTKRNMIAGVKKLDPEMRAELLEVLSNGQG